MKIAVTGGSGFIGKELLVLALKETKYDLCVVGMQRNKTSINVGQTSVKYIYTDYSVDSLQQAFKKADAVIHLASKKPIARTSISLFSDFLPNIELASNVFETCRRAGISNIINASTISVYGAKNIQPFNENQRPLPDDYYGLTKRMIEELAECVNNKYDLKIKSLRIAHVLGAGVNERYMYKVFLRQALSDLPITIWGQGEGKREYIYVKDVAESLLSALTNINGIGSYNIGSGYNTSHKELAQLVVKETNSKSSIKLDTGKQEDKYSDVMDISRANLELGWKAKWTLDRIITDTVVELAGD